jgi:hypothetical protein
MTMRRRLAALLVSLAGSLAPDSAEPATRRPAPVAPAPTPAPPPPPVRQTPASDDARNAAIRQLLESCAYAFVPGGRHVRGNIMTFTSDRLRRIVNRDTAFNMEGDADADLEIGANAGASGKSVIFRRAAVADLTLLQITAVPAWGLTATEQARVRPRLRSILSVPIFNPENANGPLLGTLQIDSDLTVEEAGFNRPEAAELMQQFADVVSLMMVGVPVRLGDVEVPTTTPMSHSRVQNATQVEAGIYVANASTSIFTIARAQAGFNSFNR